MAEEGSLLAIIIAQYSSNVNKINQLRRNHIANRGFGDADPKGLDCSDQARVDRHWMNLVGNQEPTSGGAGSSGALAGQCGYWA